MIQDNPNILLMTLTWCHCTPSDIPTRICDVTISNELQVDDVACAQYVIWQFKATFLIHQGCPVAVHDSQVVELTVVTALNLKCIEVQINDQSLLHLYCFSGVKVAWVLAREPW